MGRSSLPPEHSPRAAVPTSSLGTNDSAINGQRGLLSRPAVCWSRSGRLTSPMAQGGRPGCGPPRGLRAEPGFPQSRERLRQLSGSDDIRATAVGAVDEASVAQVVSTSSGIQGGGGATPVTPRSATDAMVADIGLQMPKFAVGTKPRCRRSTQAWPRSHPSRRSRRRFRHCSAPGGRDRRPGRDRGVKTGGLLIALTCR